MSLHPFSLSLRGIDSYAQNHISHMVLKCKEQLLLFKSKHARAKRSKSNLDDFTTFPTFLYRHCKISILVENDIYNFSSFLLKCVSHPFENADLIASVLFSASLISDNHSKTLVCFFQECPPTLELLWITWKASLKEKLKILKQQKVWVHRCWKNGWNINKPFNHHLVKWEGTNSRIFKFPLHLVFLLVNYRGMCYLGR